MWFSQARGLTDVLAAQMYFDDSILALLQLSKLPLSESTYSNTKKKDEQKVGRRPGTTTGVPSQTFFQTCDEAMRTMTKANDDILFTLLLQFSS